MSKANIEEIRKEIINDPVNKSYRKEGYAPLFIAGPKARIVIVGQAPGLRAQKAGQLWKDKSGDRLRSWLGVDEEMFYNPEKFAHLPMDFYYPGKGSSGDQLPRKHFADQWHPRLLHEMPKIEMLILAGVTAQKYYLGDRMKGNLTETVRSFEEYLPKYFPIVHPSPLNYTWHSKNPWFEREVVPKLQERVKKILK